MSEGIVWRHVTAGDLTRLKDFEMTEEEVKQLSSHLLSCRECRNRFMDSLKEPLAKSLISIREVVKLSEAESHSILGDLLARAEWDLIRKLPKTAQRDHVVLSRACHSREFLSLLLEVVKQPTTRSEGETAARLALLSIKGLDPGKWSKVEGDRLTAQIWIELANSRRLAAEWEGSDDALKRAAPLVVEDRLLEARWLSVSASVQCDRGHWEDAIQRLNRSRVLYEEANQWNLVGRCLVKEGAFLTDYDPERGLIALCKAESLVTEDDPLLLWFLEITRAECLIETRQLFQALDSYRISEQRRRRQFRPRTGIRSKFTAARLLEALGKRDEAERLFQEVLSEDLEHALIKDGFLDLLYLFAFHVRAGEPRRAANLGRNALVQLELMGSVHEQLRNVWAELIEAAERQALDLRFIPLVKEYLRVWWRKPGPESAIGSILSGK